MQKILIRPAEIESCWQTMDACIIRTRAGKTWVLERYLPQNYKVYDFIQQHIKDDIVEVPLKEGGNYGR